MKTIKEHESRPRRGILGWVCAVLSCGILASVLVVLAGWIGGDLHAWSQQLSWVPPIMILLALLLCMLLASFVRYRFGRCLQEILVVFLLFAASWVLGTEWGMFRSSDRQPEDFVVVHWNAAWPGETFDFNRVYGYLEESGADLVVITEPGRFGWGDAGKKALARWPHAARTGNVQVLSSRPLHDMQQVLGTEDLTLVGIGLELGGRTAEVWALDMPSDPSLLRGELFDSLADQLEGMERSEPDLILGDFNVTRHSMALERTFPAVRNAFDLAGQGWSGTWPRELPLWQIDQVLVAPSMDCVLYEIIDLGVGRHRLQRAVLRWHGDRPAM